MYQDDYRLVNIVRGKFHLKNNPAEITEGKKAQQENYDNYGYLAIIKVFDFNNLQTDEDPPHAYIQTFVLKPIGNSFFVQHDMFRLALHDC